MQQCSKYNTGDGDDQSNEDDVYYNPDIGPDFTVNKEDVYSSDSEIPADSEVEGFTVEDTEALVEQVLPREINRRQNYLQEDEQQKGVLDSKLEEYNLIRLTVPRGGNCLLHGMFNLQGS